MSKIFRIKLNFKSYDFQGDIVDTKTEVLMESVDYSEAEKMAYRLWEDTDHATDTFDYEIIKTKIEDIAFNDTFAVAKELLNGLVEYYFEESEKTEVGIYDVTVKYEEQNETTGKVKMTPGSIFVPASSPNEALKNANIFLTQVGETRDWIIRGVKYDKAQSVFCTPETHKKNLEIVTV